MARIDLEKSVQTKIIEYLTLIGGYSVKVVQATKAGVPDVVCCLNGKFIAIEVKRIAKHATALQKYKMAEIEKAGGIAFEAHSVEEVKQELNRRNITCQ